MEVLAIIHLMKMMFLSDVKFWKHFILNMRDMEALIGYLSS